MGFFDFFSKKKIYKGDVVDLKEKYRVSEKQAYDNVPTVYYDILLHDTKLKVGSIDLRLTVEGDMYYYGHIGYNIIRTFRGHNYAYYACLVLFKIARDEFGMDELIITCSPDNIASYRTLTKLNGELIELVEVPKNHHLFAIGESKKYIFRYRISL
ncbi:MAG: GNAT family N-acetyltransferase [Erysipelotrichaceae bacterium]|nr:GNAT family N-acetyltransferase [Erysipelotrichaceae bacterium]